jgi:ATP-dependent Clp protease ATP-binding subunit ClpA
MFERFTDKARRVIVLTQDAARDMGHGQIKPEHLLVGLQQGEGVAANAMTQGGVEGAALRERVAALYESHLSAKKIDKVPFSVEAKRCLEQSLRAALALGHNYIGTEHIFFGVLRQAEADDLALDELLGASATEISGRITDMLGGATSGSEMRSPALRSALDRARSRAGQSPMTTGHVLDGMLADPESQVSRALSELGVDPQRVQGALDNVILADTSDASPVPQSIAVTIGGTTTVIADPEMAFALQQLSTEQLHDTIKKAINRSQPGQTAG